MAHISKATRLQAIGLLKHDTRAWKNHSNENIDSTSTKYNYNFINEDPVNRYQKRLSELFVLNRKDVNTLCEVVISLPEEVTSGKDKRDFFGICWAYMVKKFGEENVVSAIVHNDESKPHIHIKAIPVYYNEKKKCEAVSFDKVCPRSFYQNFHTDLKKYVEHKLGYSVSVIKDDTIKRNKTMQEFKKLNPTEKFKIFSENNELKEEIKTLKNENETLKQYLNASDKENYSNMNVKSALEEKTKQYNKLYSAFENVIEFVKDKVPKLHEFLINNNNIYKTISDNMEVENKNDYVL